MALKLLDVEKFVKEKNASVVSNPQNFVDLNVKNHKEIEPTPDGLYSKQIFGYNISEQREKYGYIDLKTVVIHPLIYNNLKKISSILHKVVCDRVPAVVLKGEIIEDEKGSSGVKFFVSNFDKIDFEKYKTENNEEFVDFILSTQKKLITIEKVPVIPVLYRPYGFKKGRIEEDEITDFYKKILFNITSKKSTNNSAVMELDSILQTADTLIDTRDKIQKIIVNLYQYFLNKLEKKEGFFRSKLIGKRLDNVARLVANARPDIPIDGAVIPWAVLLNIFDVYVIAELNKNKETIKQLNLEDHSIDDIGKHFYYIYKNCNIYCGTMKEKIKLWYDILEKVFNNNPHLRILIKRDPGWAASSFWCLKPLIGKGCQYQIIVPSHYYNPLAGDSFATNIFIYENIDTYNEQLDKKNKILFLNNNNEKINTFDFKTLKNHFNELEK